VVQPLASGLYAVPLVILYPLFTAWFGIGPQSKIVFASIYGLLPCFLASLLPCFLGTVAGVQTIGRQYVTVARSMKAPRWPMISRVLLPAAIPTVLSAFRIGGAPVIVALVIDFDGLVRLLERRTRHWRLSTRSAYASPHAPCKRSSLESGNDDDYSVLRQRARSRCYAAGAGHALTAQPACHLLRPGR
jgi:NitT/TauT family transport system permease protein/taurine transport system permease protein